MQKPKLPKPDLIQLLADYQKSKNHALDCLTKTKEIISFADFHLQDLSAVDPYKRMKLRLIRNTISNLIQESLTDDQLCALTKAWNALYQLSSAHSIHYAAFSAANKST